MTASSRPLWQWSACALSQSIKTGDVSAIEAFESVSDRIDEVNGHLNAIVDDCREEAREEAKRLDEVFAKDGPAGPLHGVPITIKENIDQKGYATPNGVEAFKDIVAPDDSPVVRAMRRAGAVIVGRTNTPEFSFRGSTDNPLHGRTYNPWNDTASAGGSSGGAGSAVMAGMGALAHGNDIAGSLRFPAAANGAATVKPGFARVPAWNPSQQAERGLLAQLMSVQGLIGREVQDVRLGMAQLVHGDPHDPWMVPMPLEGPKSELLPKVAFTKETYEFDLHPAVEKALDTARDALADAGYEITEIEPPLVRECAETGIRALFGEVEAMMMADIRKYGSETINGVFDAYYELMPPFGKDELLKVMAKRSFYVRQWQLFLQDYPLVLTPFLPKPTYDWDRDLQGADGANEVLGAAIWSYSINFLGLPAGNVPANYNDGLPVGIQIVGPRFREDMILDACEAVESRIGIMAERLWQR